MRQPWKIASTKFETHNRRPTGVHASTDLICPFFSSKTSCSRPASWSKCNLFSHQSCNSATVSKGGRSGQPGRDSHLYVDRAKANRFSDSVRNWTNLSDPRGVIDGQYQFPQPLSPPRCSIGSFPSFLLFLNTPSISRPTANYINFSKGLKRRTSEPRGALIIIRCISRFARTMRKVRSNFYKDDI